MSLLGIDVGTSLCKAAAFTPDGVCLAWAQREYDILHPAPGWAELPAGQVWQKVQEVIAEVVQGAPSDPVSALCIGSMGEALVPVTRSREVLGDSIVCFDPRGQEYADALSRDFTAAEFYGINANLIGPQYGLPKLLWTRAHQPELFARADHFLPFSECMAFLLGAEPCFSNSQACRSLLLDVYAGDWSERLLTWSDLSRAKLGRVVPGGAVIGTVGRGIGARLGLPPGVPIVAGAHDQCVTALGCGCTEPGMAVCGLGTFQCITPVFTMPADPLQMFRHQLNIECHALAGRYVAFLYNQAGSLVKWFRDTFATHEKDAADIYARLAAEMPAAATGLLVLPHFDPPVWPRAIPDSAGAILGLHTHTTRGEILKAIMEGAALYFAPGVRALAEMGMPLKTLVAVGGGAKSDGWVQINADVLGVPVLRPRHAEAGLVGAAMLAGSATGVFRDVPEAAARMVQMDRRFEPRPDHHHFYAGQSERLAALHPLLREVLRPDRAGGTASVRD